MRKYFLFTFLILLAGTIAFIYFYKGGKKFKNILGIRDITEGVIEYDITYPKLDPNSIMISGMPNKAYLHFKNNNISNSMSGMMGLISIAFIANSTSKSVQQTLTLINKKYVSDVSAEDMKKMNESYLMRIEKGKNTAEIAGYKCKEAIVTLKNGEAIHVYYTKDIGITNPNWSNPFNQIDGVLMDFQIERYGITMHLKAKSVTAQKVDDSVFMISNEYKKIPFAELEKILQELNHASN
jgi:hypothetical protein